MEKLTNYLITHYKEDIINILKDNMPEKHFSININFMQLFEENTYLGNKFLTDFDSTMSECSIYLNDVQKLMLEEVDDGFVKQNVHIRVFSLPSCRELNRSVFPGNEDLELFLQVTGTVIRTSVAKVLEFRRAYKCTKCKEVTVVDADFYQKFLIQPPRRCKNPDCNANNFISDSEIGVNTCKDFQEIKIQEQISQARYGCMPNSLWVILEDDLVDSCKPGDNITVCGVVKRQFKPLTIGKKIEVQIVVKANHIQVNNDGCTLTTITPEIKQYFTSFWEHYYKNPLAGRDIIVRSFCPHIYGLHLVKLAVLVTLAGGSRFQKKNDSGVKTRSEPHLLLVGDPGTAKSQFLRAAAKIIMRSILTTGVGSTSAGLTVTAIREGNEWQLEAGALVLSDGGICCIDEFSSMKDHDRTSIHEAMEQQTISVAKAGIVCKLNTRCSILAATNPKGNWDPNHPITINIGLPSPLLSRFDLVFILRDNVDKNWDGVVAKYILNDCTDFESKEDDLWNVEMLQTYFIAVKKLNPVLTENSNKILAAYYQFQRKAATRNKARTTVRLLDSLVRLSQAHAKLMFHTEVEVVDAITAVVLTEASMQKESSVLSLDIDIRLASSDNPEETNMELTRTVLEKLELFDILKGEQESFSMRCPDTITVDGSPQRCGKLWVKLNSNFIKRKKSFSIIYKKNRINEPKSSDGSINSNLSIHSDEELNNLNVIKSNTFDNMADAGDTSIFNIDDIVIHSTAINPTPAATRDENKKGDINTEDPSQRSKTRSYLQQFKFIPHIDEAESGETAQKKIQNNVSTPTTRNTQQSMFDTNNYDDFDFDI